VKVALAPRIALRAAVLALLTVAASISPALAQPPPASPADPAPPVEGPSPAPAERGAEPSPEVAQQSEELFLRGRSLMQQDPPQLEEACATLAQSLSLRARGDVLLNLAECHRRQGKTATAWREFDEAIRYAEAAEFTQAIETAKRYRDLLAKDLSELVIQVPFPPAGLSVELDGKRLPGQQWGVPLFVDPGVHAVSASAPGHEPFSGSVEVKDRAGRAVIPVEMKKKPEAPRPPPPKPRPAKPAESAGVPAWAIAVGSAGVVMMGVSVVFGIRTASVAGDLDDQCGDARDACPGSYDFESDRSAEVTSFGLFVGLGIAGVGAAGTGLAGILLGGGEPADQVAVQPWATPHGGGVGVRGATW
jgi:hypothetical protein